MSFYRQMCQQNLDDHDLKPGSYYTRILPLLPTTARRSRTTVPLYCALFLQMGKHSVLSHCVMIVALCNYTCSLSNKLEMDGRRTGKPNNKYHHRQQEQQ